MWVEMVLKPYVDTAPDNIADVAYTDMPNHEQTN